MKKITKKHFNKLDVKDLTEDKYCPYCGDKLSVFRHLDKYDAKTGNPISGYIQVSCCDTTMGARYFKSKHYKIVK